MDKYCAIRGAGRVLPQLRSLSMLPRGLYAPPREFTDALAGLETLIISTLPEEACVLPPGLRHLGYHRYWPTPKEYVVYAQPLLDAARALPKLQLVTATRKSSRQILDAFEDMCRDRGAEFAVYEETKCFPRPWHVDWI
ncbi:hypothetical protein FA95DRAFT_1201518 [Auriscalpium vulgare]|uniref:Uncharacterized protein n=1 Tax=Auriscalpium vulgare TaxID=40419 RepID=A0ACB8R3Y4_9AGAM|nr:hypothetical protein FA95DRAFT_1201518 [Auriscalpium vulgare]